MPITIFKRIEKKYLISPKQYKELMKLIGERIALDKYGKSTVLSIYLDTPDHLLIRNSITAKAYKEKIRLRSYGVATENSTVFFELKKKYKGVVYKRRLCITLKEAMDYIEKGILPNNSQIMQEIDYAMKLYNYPKPKILIACEREAYYFPEQSDLRMTFDADIRYRTDDIRLDKEPDGKKIIPEGYRILEFKTGTAMPLWLVDAFNKCNIRPQKFSKYATAYNEILNNKNSKGEQTHA